MTGQSITPEHIKGVERLLACVREIVDYPDEVIVRVLPAEYNAIVQLETHQADVGVVVGREGHVISSLRSLLAAYAGKNRIKLTLEFKTEQDRNVARGNERGGERSWQRDRREPERHG